MGFGNFGQSSAQQWKQRKISRQGIGQTLAICHLKKRKNYHMGGQHHVTTIARRTLHMKKCPFGLIYRLLYPKKVEQTPVRQSSATQEKTINNQASKQQELEQQ